MKQSNDFRSLNQKISMSDKEREKVQEQMNHRMNATPEVRKASTPRKYYVALGAAAVIFMLILIPAIFNNLERPSESVVVADEIQTERLEEILTPYMYEEIIHQEKVEHGVVVFFTQQTNKEERYTQIHALFIQRTQDGWMETFDRGSHSFLEKEELSQQLLSPSTEESPFPLVFGKIINPEIAEVIVSRGESEQKYPVEIITTENGERYWFSFVDVDPDMLFEIYGLTEEGQPVYSINTIYPDSLSTVLKEANPNAENFELSNVEMDVYELLKTEFDTQLLMDLSPVSIAKLYVQAALDENRELKYEFYTDRQDMMQIDKEEYLSDMGHSSAEQIRETFFGIQDGTFHDRGDSGYISYMNLYGQEWGFQVVKEEDGSWAVSFMPIQ